MRRFIFTAVLSACAVMPSQGMYNAAIDDRSPPSTPSALSESAPSSQENGPNLLNAGTKAPAWLAALDEARRGELKGTTFYLDLETTGSKAFENEIVQITLRKMVDGIPTHEVLNYYVNPGDTPISTYAFAAHGLREEDLRAAPSFADVWPRCLEFMGVNQGHTPRIYAYNAPFDMRILKEAIASHFGADYTFSCEYKCGLSMLRRDLKRAEQSQLGSPKKLLKITPPRQKITLRGMSPNELASEKEKIRLTQQQARAKKTAQQRKPTLRQLPLTPQQKKGKKRPAASLALASVVQRLGFENVPAGGEDYCGSMPAWRNSDHDAVVDTRKAADLMAALVDKRMQVAEHLLFGE